MRTDTNGKAGAKTIDPSEWPLVVCAVFAAPVWSGSDVESCNAASAVFVSIRLDIRYCD